MLVNTKYLAMLGSLRSRAVCFHFGQVCQNEKGRRLNRSTISSTALRYRSLDLRLKSYNWTHPIAEVMVEVAAAQVAIRANTPNAAGAARIRRPRPI